jgi:hypothetical protein
VFAAVEPDRRRRFIQLLEKKTDVVEMLPLAAREAAAWLKQYLGQAGVEIADELAAEIVEKFERGADSRGDAKRAGVNLLWLRTEMEKVLTARPGAKSLQPADLDLIVTLREEHEIGKLLAAIVERRFGEAVGQLRALLAGKESEILLLWCIGDLFRQALKSGGRAPYGRGSWGRFANPFSTQQLAPRLHPPGAVSRLAGGPPGGPGSEILLEGFESSAGISPLGNHHRKRNRGLGGSYRGIARSVRRSVIRSCRYSLSPER